MTNKTLLLLLIAPFCFLGCQSSKKEPQASWSGQMQNMAQDIRRLIPYVYDQQAYTQAAHEKTIEQALTDLNSQSHKVPTKMGEQFLGEDPIITYSLGHLKGDLSRALSSFKNGQKDYSRSVLKSSIGHCFRCHSLTTIGAQARWDLSDFKNLKLNPEEKLELLVAARKYKEAFAFAEEQITAPGLVKKNALMFENLLRKYLALSLRVSQEPMETLKDLQRVLANKEMPVYLEKQVKAWTDSLKNWKKVPLQKDFIGVARARIKKAKHLQEFAYDHAGDVEYIWATDILHEGLRADNEKNKEGEIYYLLGVSYESLGDLGSYALHETYYEACIQKVPHTKLAKHCFQRLEASVIQGFSGSAGLSLPTDERERLNRLKKLL